MSLSKIRLAYLVTHPIQYQAPLLRLIAQLPNVDLTVFFCSDYSVKQFKDEGFGAVIEWDVPLLDGYKYEFLPAWGKNDVISFWRPFNYGLAKRLKQGQFDILWIHGYMRWLHWIAIVVAHWCGIKVLIRDEASLISTERGWLKKLFKRMLFFGLRQLTDGFLAIGSLNRDYYHAYGIQPEKVFLVPYAVDNLFFQQKALAATVSREELRESLGLQANRPIILYASKMQERKRAGDLLQAYQQLSPDGHTEPHPYLLFIGDGEKRAQLEQQARQLGWNSIKFLGFINQTELPHYYDLCSVFVLPSVHEPWGLVVNEVMNAKRAIIVSDQVGCAPDLVRHGENGYIFQPGDIDNLSHVLQLALADKEHCQVMGEKSLGLIENWGFKQDIIGLETAFEAVLGKEL